MTTPTTPTTTNSHEQQAEKYASDARAEMRVGDAAMVYASLAQAEATLELVYEVRRVADALERIAGIQ